LTLVGGGGEAVDFSRLLASHGVATLAPQRIDHDSRSLETTLGLPGGRAATIRLALGGPNGDEVTIDALGGRFRQGEVDGVLERVRRMINLDEDLSGFYALAADDPAMSWATSGAGRMLRGPTVFEDVAKTVCTTNCAWSATVRMVNAIVDHLGHEAPGGARCFPSAESMAEAGEDFYRDVARAGYRGPYLIGLSRLVADGSVDLEGLSDPGLSEDDVMKRLLALPGVGPYAAAHVMLISLGRCRRLILDSWTRPTFAELTGAPATDKEIAARFEGYGEWAGLAFWLFITRHWVDEDGKVAQE
jgi:3-methyladenine DNA glycosylase/8-oxoguanine DNA glycosylase